MIDRETKIVKLSILVLCFALIFVYVIWFYVKGDQVDTLYGIGTGNSVGNSPLETGTSSILSQTGDNRIVHDDAPLTSSDSSSSSEDSYDPLPPVVQEKIILSGTKVLESGAEFADVLGIHYKYALIDNKGIEYLYLGEGLNNDFAEILHQYDGTLYAMDTEYEIKKNELWGDRVLFLNFPGYEKKIVLMVVKVKSGYWLIKINYNQYHKLKPYLKSLFTE